MDKQKTVLLIYTGGTIGMKKTSEDNMLHPVDFEHILDEVPEIKKFGFTVETIAFPEPIDSSDINPAFWQELGKLIFQNYHHYNGFVILHGTDTMAFTASALSFMLENLNKPVILTGSQLPIGTLRTDGKENIITAIEIAAAEQNEQPLVPEVCIYFENQLLRGNRTSKYNAAHFNAFRSENYPALAIAGIDVEYATQNINYPVEKKELKLFTKFSNKIGVLKIFPGISPEFVDAVLQTTEMEALILESFGSGNATTEKWFLEKLKKNINKGLVVLNTTQCSVGKVNMSLYETGKQLLNVGVLNGYDITFEAAVTKLSFLFGNFQNKNEIISLIKKNLRGEINF